MIAGISKPTGILLSLLIGTACLAQSGDYVPVTDEMLRNPDPEDWLSFRRTLDSWGFSPLEQISKDNVGALELVWSAELHDGVLPSTPIQEGTPLVYDGMMYLPNPGDVIQARDATTGDMLWEYVRQMPEDLGDYLGANKTMRNVAIYDDAIIYTTNDDYILALDVHTGEISGKQRSWTTAPIRRSRAMGR